ncbi:unannotated protein [freshwater metagenome]|uniref:Unannotated protein n=1 Tax=freshwater metagenome TaxID=449393 RepID=A0A6J7ILG4_9ZZZZ|nr:PAS domain S-box protein [Actinomycetota bacterium]
MSTASVPTGPTAAHPASAERAFWAIFNRAGNPMLVTNSERRYVTVNETALAFLGRTREELLAMRIDDITAPEELEGLPGTWDAFLQSGTLNGSWEIVDGNGHHLRVDYNATANVLPGRHLSIFVVTPTDKGAASTVADRAPLVVTNAPRRTGNALSPRERQVLQLLAEGLTSGQLAEALGISEETVKTHVTNAKRKLGAHTRAQAIALALRDGDLAFGS